MKETVSDDCRSCPTGQDVEEEKRRGAKRRERVCVCVCVCTVDRLRSSQASRLPACGENRTSNNKTWLNSKRYFGVLPHVNPRQGRVSTPSKERGNERNEMRLLVGIRFVPVRKKCLLGPCRILSLAGRISTDSKFCTCHGKLVSTPIFVVSIYIKSYAICSRSVGPFGPTKEEKEVQHFFLFLDTLFFLGCTESVRFAQPISTN